MVLNPRRTQRAIQKQNKEALSQFTESLCCRSGIQRSLTNINMCDIWHRSRNPSLGEASTTETPEVAVASEVLLHQDLQLLIECKNAF